jgi:hypothetical protein
MAVTAITPVTINLDDNCPDGGGNNPFFVLVSIFFKM